MKCRIWAVISILLKFEFVTRFRNSMHIHEKNNSIVYVRLMQFTDSIKFSATSNIILLTVISQNMCVRKYTEEERVYIQNNNYIYCFSYFIQLLHKQSYISIPRYITIKYHKLKSKWHNIYFIITDRNIYNCWNLIPNTLLFQLITKHTE